jgi:hypothetical protein
MILVALFIVATYLGPTLLVQFPSVGESFKAYRVLQFLFARSMP